MKRESFILVEANLFTTGLQDQIELPYSLQLQHLQNTWCVIRLRGKTTSNPEICQYVPMATNFEKNGLHVVEIFFQQ